MGTPVTLYDSSGKPLYTEDTLYGNLLMVAEPSRIRGWFKAVTNADDDIQTIVACAEGQALFVTDILLSANKVALSTTTVRFFDGTNIENIFIADTAEGTVNISIQPSGRTVGWDNAAIQLVTDKNGQAATCTIWYLKLWGDKVKSYAKWNSERDI